MGNFCFCGKEKREDRLTCPRCFELYRTDTKGKIDLAKWVEKRCLERLEDLGSSDEDPRTTLERDVLLKKEELRSLEEALSEEVNLLLNRRIAGAGRLRKKEVDALREDIRKELWQNKGGNRIYAELKDLQKEVKIKVHPIRETLQQIEKTEKELSSVDRLVDSIFPNRDQ
jgi:hypothetical protein